MAANTPYTMPPPDQLFAVVPPELQDIDQWVTWTLKKRDNKAKLDKIPRNPHNGQYASSTDPATWGTFKQAVEAAVARGHNGVGFVLAEGTPIVGIDLDGCLDPATGMLEVWAEDIVSQFDSYTEVSPSGTGIRIFVEGTKHTTECRKDNIEIYNWGRFLTVTGDKLEGTPSRVEKRQAKIDLFTQWLFGSNEEPSTEPEAEPSEKTSRNGKHQDSLITTAFSISPTAAPPFQKWAKLCRAQPSILAIFNHTNVSRYGLASDGTGPNMSKIEQALANYAIGAGWTDQETVDLIIAHRVAHGEVPKHLKYYQHTITAAHDDKLRKKTLEAPTAPSRLLTADTTATSTNGHHSPTEAQQDSDTEEIEATEDEDDRPLLGEGGKLSTVLNLPVLKMIKYATEPPSYRMITARGEISFATVGKLIHQGYLREQIANMGHIIPTINKRDWPTVQQWLLDACEIVDAGEDATEAGQVRAWLQAYFTEHRIKPDFEAAVATRLPYKEEGRIVIFGPDLRSFIGSALREYVSAQILGARLRSFGALPHTVYHTKPNGDRTSYHVWKLPADYDP